MTVQEFLNGPSACKFCSLTAHTVLLAAPQHQRNRIACEAHNAGLLRDVIVLYRETNPGWAKGCMFRKCPNCHEYKMENQFYKALKISKVFSQNVLLTCFQQPTRLHTTTSDASRVRSRPARSARCRRSTQGIKPLPPRNEGT